MKEGVLWEGSALRIRQPIGEFWCAVIPARVLMVAASPDPLRVIADNPKETEQAEWKVGLRMLGSQRGLDPKKLEEIGEYVDALDSTFPNSIIIAVNSQIPNITGTDKASQDSRP